MDGVTILNTYQWFSLFESILLACGIAGAVVCCAITLSMLDENVIISGIFGGLMVLVIIACFTIPASDTIYEVTISDDVSWTEFSKHYEVLQERGRILKVKGRTEVKDDRP